MRTATESELWWILDRYLYEDEAWYRLDPKTKCRGEYFKRLTVSFENKIFFLDEKGTVLVTENFKRDEDKSTTKSPVPDMLRLLGDLYSERNKLYGDNYKFFGDVMMGLFPRGLTLKTRDDWNRLGVFIQAMSKATRYAQQFEKGGHADSLDDMSVYAQMLQELDATTGVK